jgi:hypothetical protein
VEEEAVFAGEEVGKGGEDDVPRYFWYPRSAAEGIGPPVCRSSS